VSNTSVYAPGGTGDFPGSLSAGWRKGLNGPIRRPGAEHVETAGAGRAAEAAWHHVRVSITAEPGPSTPAPELVRAVMTCATSVFGGAGVVNWTPLAAGERAEVARVAMITDQGARSVVIKAGDVRRERVALETLASLGVPGGPELLAAGDAPPLLMLADAGDGPTLAQRLLGGDRDAATAAVTRWAGALGRFQAATLGAGRPFLDRLTAHWRPGDDWIVDSTGDLITEAAAILDELLPKLGAGFGADATAALAAIGDRLGADVDATAGPGALTPGDTCPDNNVESGAGITLLDFEFAEFRHVAWEAAYLTVPWPTCWCAWRMPEEVTAGALRAWRTALEPALAPEVAAGLDDAIRDATVAWALMTSAWLLPRALGLEEHGPAPAGRERPEPRALIRHRLAVAAQTTVDGPLREVATAALEATGREWGECPLPFAPAFTHEGVPPEPSA
jgi:hypothetical protein